jgi:hypothetical protein
VCVCVCVCVRARERETQADRERETAPGTPRFNLGVDGDWILGSLPLASPPTPEHSVVANDPGVGCVSGCYGGASKWHELHAGRYVAVCLAKLAREKVMLCNSEV